MKIEFENRTEWYNGNAERHREDGPAIEYANGTKSWYLNGELVKHEEPEKFYWDGEVSKQEYEVLEFTQKRLDKVNKISYI